ncbi:MAG: YhcH/YjgK/YiaL family protein [Clostridia bacterium]|nr:YhcH/YjgK/YiaL family protein [Clostridia bacterium]
MIIASIKNKDFEKYFSVHPRLKPALEAAVELIEKGAADGKYEIDGDNIYLTISTYETKTHDNAKLEIHKDYIDVQLVIEGKELIGMDSVEGLEVISPYTTDYALYVMSEDYDKIFLGAGEFAVIFPNEGHAPCMAADGTPSKVRKMVIKIRA